MVWLRSLTIMLALGSATWAYTQATGTQPAVKDKSDNLQLRLEPKDIQMGVPKAFTFVLVNISDHDVRVPMPVVDCGYIDSTGSLQLQLKFIPLGLVHTKGGTGCGGSIGSSFDILLAVQGWKLLHAGKSLSIEASKSRLLYEEQNAGTYEFWAAYKPPTISEADQATLRQAGIDFPHDVLTSAHITFVKTH